MSGETERGEIRVLGPLWPTPARYPESIRASALQTS